MARIGNDLSETLRSEWTKLRSSRSIGWLLVALVLAVALSLVGASQTSTSFGGGPSYVDEFRFVHRPLTGDGSIAARVLTQERSHEWAKAGVMVKEHATSGATYVALMVTPEHGVRLQSGFVTMESVTGGWVGEEGMETVTGGWVGEEGMESVTGGWVGEEGMESVTGGSGSPAPRWLRLVRSGATITGHESPDGATWTEVGTVRLPALLSTVEVGLFVSSPPDVVTTQDGNNTSSDPVPTTGTATFDNVTVTASSPAPADPWQSTDVGGAGGGRVFETDGMFTVTGSGDIASVRPEGNDDIVRVTLTGLQIAVLALIVFGVGFTSSEYRQGLARTTFAASPQRGRVLAAKAVITGTVAFTGGLAASVTAFLASQPVLHRNGYIPPAYPYLSLLDPPVLRAVVGSALFLAALALLGLGTGVIVRHTAAALAAVIGIVLVPQIVAGPLGAEVGTWIRRVSPTAGLTIQQTRGDYPIDPWLGVGVAFGYAGIALAAGYLLLRRRDV